MTRYELTFDGEKTHAGAPIISIDTECELT
jgi:hypothetical protein